MCTIIRSCLAAALVSFLSVPATAQWVKVPSKGKVDLAASTPRAADGHPDLSGIWEPLANRYLGNIAADLKPEDVPFQPWAKALYESRADGSHSKEDPDANCLPQGVPKIDAAPAPWRIVQTPGYVVVTDTWGGTISGYCAIGITSRDSNPAIVVTMAMTVARRGRSINMAENMIQLALGGAGAGLARTGEPARRLSIPCTTTCSPPFSPSSTIT